MLRSWTVHLGSLKAECRGELEAPTFPQAPHPVISPLPTEATTWCWLPTVKGVLLSAKAGKQKPREPRLGQEAGGQPRGLQGRRGQGRREGGGRSRQRPARGGR